MASAIQEWWESSLKEDVGVGGMAAPAEPKDEYGRPPVFSHLWTAAFWSWPSIRALIGGEFGRYGF